MPAIGYASHYLRLGQYIVRMPLLRVDEGKLISLQHFEEEAERISFIDGYLELRHKDFPNSGEPPIELSPEALLELIGARLLELEFIEPSLYYLYKTN